MQPDLFGADDAQPNLPDGAVLMRGAAKHVIRGLSEALDMILAGAPFRHMKTPNGHTMSVAMTNCGDWGWISDSAGYRYVRHDPTTKAQWPIMPDVFMALASRAAAEAGYPFFRPDVCLINRYQPGAKLSLHQDKDESNFSHPIVSVSLGIPAAFQFGGKTRRDPIQLIEMVHGDVFVWGGPSRLNFHGIRPIKDGQHPDFGPYRINLTFRKAH